MKCHDFSLIFIHIVLSEQVNSAAKILELLHVGNSRRKTERTDANAISSRYPLKGKERRIRGHIFFLCTFNAHTHSNCLTQFSVLMLF